MNLNFDLSPYPTLLEDIISIVYEVDSSGVLSEVARQTVPETNGAGVPTVGAGHPIPVTISFNGLDKVTHEIRNYTDSGTLLHRYQRQPVNNVITMFDYIRFRIGDGGANTPTAGASAYVNPIMAGMTADDYVAIRNGSGALIDGVHIVNNVLGGFQLFQPGDIFNDVPPEEWTIIPKPKAVTMPVNDSVVGKQWGPTSLLADMFVDVSSEIAYTPAHLRKLIRLAGTNALYKFTATDVPPVGYVFRVTNFGAYAIGSVAPKVKFENANLLWGNTTKTELEIPFTATCEFSFDGANWNCTMNAVPPSSAIQSNQIVASGRFVLGDVSESTQTVAHGLNILYPYRVFGVVYSRNPSHTRDNTVTFCVHDFTANNFKFSIQEIFGEVQTIDFDWIIVKI